MGNRGSLPLSRLALRLHGTDLLWVRRAALGKAKDLRFHRCGYPALVDNGRSNPPTPSPLQLTAYRGTTGSTSAEGCSRSCTTVFVAFTNSPLSPQTSPYSGCDRTAENCCCSPPAGSGAPSETHCSSTTDQSCIRRSARHHRLRPRPSRLPIPRPQNPLRQIMRRAIRPHIHQLRR